MKKQIFILVLAFLALGITQSYGQLASRAVTCLKADALHPVAGTAFTYQIEVPGTPGGGGTAWTAGSLKYVWFVTQNPNFITDVAGVPTLATTGREASTGSLLASTDGAYNATGGSLVNSTVITWKSFNYVPTVPVFVVISAVGNNGTCDLSNVKVFKVEPFNSFTLDIDNLTELGAANTPLAYGDNYIQCISPIKSAIYDGTTGITYDYGTNVLEYEIVAANYMTSWKPTINLSGVDPNETITVQYTKDATFATGLVVMTGPANSTATTAVLSYTTAAAGILVTAGDGLVGATGERIYVRVTLDHTDGLLRYQGLSNETVVLAVDGLTNLSAAAAADKVGDVHYQAGPDVATIPAQACPWVDGFANDIATQTIKARPTITSNTVGVLPNPNPGDFLLVK